MVEVEDVVGAELRRRWCGRVGCVAGGGEELRAAGDDEEEAQGEQQGAKGSGWVSDCHRPFATSEHHRSTMPPSRQGVGLYFLLLQRKIQGLPSSERSVPYHLPRKYVPTSGIEWRLGG